MLEMLVERLYKMLSVNTRELFQNTDMRNKVLD